MRSPGYQKSKQFVEIKQVVNTIIGKIGGHMNKPMQSFRDRGLDVSVWETKKGGFSFTLRKTYKNKETNQYVETKYFFKEEVEKLIELLQEAVKYASNRAEHDVNHIASGGYNKAPTAAKVEEIDLDDIPF
jgi:hypothetical protein